MRRRRHTTDWVAVGAEEVCYHLMSHQLPSPASQRELYAGVREEAINL